MDGHNPNTSTQEVIQQPQQKDIDNKSKLAKNVNWFFIYLAVIPISVLIGVITAFALTYFMAAVFPESTRNGDGETGIVFLAISTIINSIYVILSLLLIAEAKRRGKYSKTTILLLILILLLYIFVLSIWIYALFIK